MGGAPLLKGDDARKPLSIPAARHVVPVVEEERKALAALELVGGTDAVVFFTEGTPQPDDPVGCTQISK
jgi:hypothetical protein